jgi:hypothetical protein
MDSGEAVTCQYSRAAYIDSIHNLCDVTDAVSKLRQGYVQQIRDLPLTEATESISEWHKYVDALQRLIDEQRVALDIYAQDAARHP